MSKVEEFSTFSSLPELGDINAYISAVYQYPMLTLEEEQEYLQRYRATGDTEAEKKLILSHLRLVVSISRQFLGYGLPHADLIQEGNIGLIKAIRKFVPQDGNRLVGYAMVWIKADINEYIIKNFRISKIATTKPQRKLFFNLRSMKQKFNQDDPSESRIALTDSQIKIIASELNVPEHDVREMDMRLSGFDMTMDNSTEDEEDVYSPITYLTDESTPESTIETHQNERLLTDGLSEALELLDDRTRKIIVERWLNVDDENSGMTLVELGQEFSISSERVRQIEVAGMKKMRKFLETYETEKSVAEYF